MDGKYFSGSFGLISTAEDYFRFAQMLLNGGELEGHRVIGAKTLALLTQPQVTEETPGMLAGTQFGLGVRIVTRPEQANSRLSAGAYGWPGALGTFFWVDPTLDLVAIFMGQMINITPRLPRPVRAQFEQAVMQSILP